MGLKRSELIKVQCFVKSSEDIWIIMFAYQFQMLDPEYDWTVEERMHVQLKTDASQQRREIGLLRTRDCYTDTVSYQIYDKTTSKCISSS